MPARKWYIDEALHSYLRLLKVLPEMTEEEVLTALRLEAASKRRPSLMNRLLGRAARLNEMAFVAQLKKELGYE